MAKSPTRRNYAQLAERARLLMASQGLSENAASDAVAEEVAPDNPESVARSIRRHLMGAKPKGETETPKASARVGLGVIYNLLSNYLKTLDRQALKLCHTAEQFAAVTRKVQAVRKLLEQRSAELTTVTAADAAEQAVHLLAGLQDPILAPADIVERETQVVKALLAKADDLLSSIDLWSTMDPTV